MPKVLVSFLTAIALAWAIAGPATAEPTSQATADNFMQMIADGEAEAALDKHMSPALKRMAQSGLQNMISQLMGWNMRIGGIQGFEMVFNETVTSRTKHYVYLMHHEQLPVVYSFYLYKVGDEWKITNFTFNTDFENLDKKVS